MVKTLEQHGLISYFQATEQDKSLDLPSDVIAQILKVGEEDQLTALLQPFLECLVAGKS
jgi:hypothetical protein